MNTSSMDLDEFQQVGDDFPASHVGLSEASARVQALYQVCYLTKKWLCSADWKMA